MHLDVELVHTCLLSIEEQMFDHFQQQGVFLRGKSTNNHFLMSLFTHSRNEIKQSRLKLASNIRVQKCGLVKVDNGLQNKKEVKFFGRQWALSPNNITFPQGRLFVKLSSFHEFYVLTIRCFFFFSYVNYHHLSIKTHPEDSYASNQLFSFSA